MRVQFSVIPFRRILVYVDVQLCSCLDKKERLLAVLAKYFKLSENRVLILNSVLCGLPSYQIAKLLHVQNAAARLISKTQRSDHITPVLFSLHWLPIEARISFKIQLLTYKILNGHAPGYLSDLISSYKPNRHNLRSAEKNLLAVPRTQLKTFGDRTFSVASPVLWNTIPLAINNSSTISVFKKRLKTFLFKRYFNV